MFSTALTIALTNEVAKSTLGTLIGDPSSPTRAYVRQHADDTIDFRITSIPAITLPSVHGLLGL